MLTSKFKGESSRKDQTCDAKDLWATHRSDLSKKLYLPVLDRRTHPFAEKQQISFWKYTFGTVGDHIHLQNITVMKNVLT